MEVPYLVEKEEKKKKTTTVAVEWVSFFSQQQKFSDRLVPADTHTIDVSLLKNLLGSIAIPILRVVAQKRLRDDACHSNL